ncbi:uncharacterized protein [Elaeis guineensis]|uniref:uncharacterized protein n=1 Tax=Elaeis guineensis var. tenera TaxID=51953 RepID=UPI003C6D2DDA
MEDESVEHVVLRCPKTRVIWRQTCGYPWETSIDPWLVSFLGFIRQSMIDRTTTVGGRMTYIAYQIWLSRNSIVFDGEVILAPIHRVLSISWEPPPSGFVKINFDGSVRNGRGGAGFVIRGPDGRLLTVGGSHSLSFRSRMRNFTSLGQMSSLSGNNFMQREFF